ncbi:MAG: hypothetical protein PHT16_01495 [Candidatus Pacebacteria bacterium]|nr:hypothetical protein [Candidatus Paceibacterota bacterium]
MKTQQSVIQDLFLEYGLLNSDLTINELKIKPILAKLKKGLKQYLSIQRSVNITDTSKDILFQEMFSNFYGFDRNRDSAWKKEYFNLFETLKIKDRDFKKTLEGVYTKTNKIEPSFSSKLLATLNPDLPVIDKWILKNLSLEKESQKISRLKDVSERLNETENLYKKLSEMFEEFITTKGADNLFDRFVSEYPFTNTTQNSSLTKAKMLDLILWQLRRK